MACTLNRKGHHILSLTQKLHSQILVLLQLMLGLIFTKPMLAHPYICFDIILSASTKFTPSHLHLELKSPFKYAPYAKERTFEGMDCKSPSLCLPPLNPIQQMKSLILHILQFFKQVGIWLVTTRNSFSIWQFRKFGGFFSNFKEFFFSKLLFSVPKIFTILSPQFQNSNKKAKKNTGHNFTT
jgi:hypothetical protein